MQAQYAAMGGALDEAAAVSRGVFEQPQEYDIFVLTSETGSAENDLDGESFICGLRKISASAYFTRPNP